jgi:hypothetical protein
VVVAVLLVVVGPAGRPNNDQQNCCHHAPTVKPEAATAVVDLLMMGLRMPETCSAVFKQVINVKNCCIWLDDSVKSMMMHGLAYLNCIRMLGLINNVIYNTNKY